MYKISNYSSTGIPHRTLSPEGECAKVRSGCMENGCVACGVNGAVSCSDTFTDYALAEVTVILVTVAQIADAVHQNVGHDMGAMALLVEKLFEAYPRSVDMEAAFSTCEVSSWQTASHRVPGAPNRSQKQALLA